MPTCSFCYIEQADAKCLIQSPQGDVRICDGCLDLAVGIFAVQNESYGEAAPRITDEKKRDASPERVERAVRSRRAMESYRCSFCGKHRMEVRHMMSGPSNYICDQCVTLALSVVPGT